jgi:hypothetical protein
VNWMIDSKDVLISEKDTKHPTLEEAEVFK